MMIFNKQPQLFPSPITDFESTDTKEARLVLSAQERVRAKHHIETNEQRLKEAVETVEQRVSFLAKLKEAGIGVIESPAAVAYQKTKVWPTAKDRLSRWFDDTKDEISSFLKDIIDGIEKARNVSAGFWLWLAPATIIAFLFLSMSGLPAYSDNLGKLVASAALGFLVNILILIFIGLVSLIVTMAFSETTARKLRRVFFFGYIGLHALIISLPIRLYRSLGLAVEVFGQMQIIDREWSTVSLKAHKTPLPDSIVLLIDQVDSVLPESVFELQILEVENKQTEMFLTLPLGSGQERLYLWHQAA